MAKYGGQALLDKLQTGSYTLSAWITPAGIFVVGSQSKRLDEHLLIAGFFGTDRRASGLLKSILPLLEKSKELAPIATRSKLASDVRTCLTQHLLLVHSRDEKALESVIDDIAWRYVSLQGWGEPSTAKVLAEYLNVPVRTIHARLRLARDKGLIDAPGSGTRLTE